MNNDRFNNTIFPPKIVSDTIETTVNEEGRPVFRQTLVRDILVQGEQDILDAQIAALQAKKSEVSAQLAKKTG